MCQHQGKISARQKKNIHSTFSHIGPSILRRLNPLCGHAPGGLAVCALLGAMLTGCSSKPPSAPISIDNRGYAVDRTHPSAAQNERVRFLILHYTALNDDESLKTLTGEQVSAHYLVPQYPTLREARPVVYQLVDESKRAWHAGLSNWHGRVNLNDSSIGIETVNRGFTDDMLGRRTWYSWPPAQIHAVAALARDIIQRYQIAPYNVLGHSDVAPTRKQDPGMLFPWKALAAQGIGAWPDARLVEKYLRGRDPHSPADVKVVQALLKKYGYDAIPQEGVLDDNTWKTVSAFQMHFRPENISGIPDAETEAIASALNEQYRDSKK